MTNKKTKASAGFTIIEVLIVLAIVGLIMLIVFLAVPALQRNSRNTSIKNDVQNVIGGVSEYQGANNGRIPTAVSTAAGGGTVNYTGPGGTNATTINVQGTTTVALGGATVPQTGNGPANGTINIYLGKKCDDSANSRSIAAVYSIETTSSNTVRQCVES